MKAIEVNMDGIKYFVKVSSVGIFLYLNTLRSDYIYKEHGKYDVNKFDLRKAKKFIKRAFEV